MRPRRDSCTSPSIDIMHLRHSKIWSTSFNKCFRYCREALETLPPGKPMGRGTVKVVPGRQSIRLWSRTNLRPATSHATLVAVVVDTIMRRASRARQGRRRRVRRGGGRVAGGVERPGAGGGGGPRRRAGRGRRPDRAGPGGVEGGGDPRRRPAAVGELVPGRSSRVREPPTVFGGSVATPCGCPGLDVTSVCLIMQQAVADGRGSDGGDRHDGGRATGVH